MIRLAHVSARPLQVSIAVIYLVNSCCILLPLLHQSLSFSTSSFSFPLLVFRSLISSSFSTLLLLLLLLPPLPSSFCPSSFFLCLRRQRKFSRLSNHHKYSLTLPLTTICIIILFISYPIPFFLLIFTVFAHSFLLDYPAIFILSFTPFCLPPCVSSIFPL